MAAKRSIGFTLIELMIGIAIVAILVVAALPSFGTWIQNTKIRGAAEAALNGLQLARAEAARRNASVALVFTDPPPVAANVNAVAPSNTGRNWMLRVYQIGGVYTAADFIQGAPMAEAAAASPISVKRYDAAGNEYSSGGSSALVDTVIFNSLGQAASVLNTGTTVTDYVSIKLDFTNPVGGNCQNAATPGPMRCLRVDVSRGGNVRMCDPKVTDATDSRRC